jgi:hypothetical protein
VEGERPGYYFSNLDRINLYLMKSKNDIFLLLSSITLLWVVGMAIKPIFNH